jgi:decaprenylphospho-beta-D-erythro-pentofuranosid-2-ulose 2-reductase
MTAGMTKGGPLWATPEAVAAVVRKAADRGGPVLYAPARWRPIMAIIRMIPAPIFNKMNF